MIALESFENADAKTVRIKAETRDLSSSGVAVIVPTIRLREKYLVGEERTIYAELDLPNGKIRVELVGARYEQQIGRFLSGYGRRNAPIGEGERMWQPKLEARVLQELGVRKTDRVLEVGTGSGYLTALLSHRAAHVHTVEINPRLAELGRRNLARHGVDNVTQETGDASRGWTTHAPYDVIVLTGSTPVLPKAFCEQLAPGGRLFAVVGEAPAMTASLLTCTAPGAFGTVELFETVLKPLANAERPSRFRF